jgi:DNA-directed RNA polymerase I subunit RPA2
VSDRCSDSDAGLLLINKYLFVHTAKHCEKQECLLFMTRKLLCFAQGSCFGDNTDALANHELLLPGHLMTMFVREKLEELLLGVRAAVTKDARLSREKCLADLGTAKYFAKHFERLGGSIGGKAKSFLSTGNLVSQSGMDLMQVSGFTVVAERLNVFRYLSHFQSVHRGQFFTTMKTTTVRKLLPESWGFLCPVHTPDGSPCGLLNHMARDAVLVAFPTIDRLPYTAGGRIAGNPGEWLEGDGFRRLLVSMGVVPATVGGADGQLVLGGDFLTVMVDGVVVGGVRAAAAAALVEALRVMKTSGGADTRLAARVDPTLEIAYFPRLEHQGAYPGLFLFTQPGRMIRATQQLASGRVEWIGPMEQVHLEVACLGDDVRQDTTHCELSPSVMLSHVAALTPYSDYNQSPRNMYQCQVNTRPS